MILVLLVKESESLLLMLLVHNVWVCNVRHRKWLWLLRTRRRRPVSDLARLTR